MGDIHKTCTECDGTGWIPNPKWDDGTVDAHLCRECDEGNVRMTDEELEAKFAALRAQLAEVEAREAKYRELLERFLTINDDADFARGCCMLFDTDACRDLIDQDCDKCEWSILPVDIRAALEPVAENATTEGGPNEPN